MDIVGAGIGLALCLPLFLIVAAGIRLTSPGPALLKQTRVGKDGKTFSLFKFRSMYVDRQDVSGAARTQKDDPRVTRVGRFIRATSLDELPQLWNVVRGDMSLVGPRPNVKRETDLYTTLEKIYNE